MTFGFFLKRINDKIFFNILVLKKDRYKKGKKN